MAHQSNSLESLSVVARLSPLDPTIEALRLILIALSATWNRRLIIIPDIIGN